MAALAASTTTPVAIMTEMICDHFNHPPKSLSNIVQVNKNSDVLEKIKDVQCTLTSILIRVYQRGKY